MNNWIVFSSLSLLNHTVAIAFNILVIYIVLLRFKLKGVDDLLSFILASIDIIYALLGILNYSLYVLTSGKFQADRIYCVLAKLIMDSFSIVGLDTVVVLAIVRYLAICKKYVLSKYLATTLILVISLVTTAGVIIVILNNQPKLNTYSPVCTFNIPFNSVYSKLNILFNVHPLICLMVITACYLQVMRHYSKMELVLSEYGTASSTNSSIETGKGIQAYQSSLTQSENSQKFDKTSPNSNSIKTSSLTDTYKSQKFLPMLKITLIILIYYVEIVPYYSIQIYLSITNNTDRISELSIQITLMLADLVPLTNTFLILFIHEETWQELRLCVAIWENWIRRRF